MRRTTLILTLAFLALLAVGATALAQTGGGYDLSWNTIDGGGGSATGGNYALEGTLGQPDAGALSGGSYTLDGGYWQTAATSYPSYLPFVGR